MNLLFICTHNACRSILAETITRSMSGNRIQVASAGSDPAGCVHPRTIEFLKSNGFSTDGLTSKSFADLGDFNPTVVITVCDSAAGDACSVWLNPLAIKIHWGLPDPSHMDGSDSERAAAFLAVADTIRSRISRLLQQPFETIDKTALTELLESIGKS